MNGNEPRSLETARGYIKIAKDHAKFKKTEGYIEDNFSLLQVANLEASLDICNRGPADYYYEKAYDLLSETLGKDHPETQALVQKIINYHVDNAKRMFAERYLLTGLYLIGVLYLLLHEIFDTNLERAIAYALCYTSLFAYWFLEYTLVSLMERHHYRRIYKT
jgi:hypothetical protein